MTIAALYIDPRGPYPALLGAAACWDEVRDARRYAGPHPVVAHPDCGPWGHLRYFYQGNGHDCGPRAVEQVRHFGGVLEHPSHSLLWRTCGLPRPGAGRDAWGGFSVAVNQVDWGHVARKPTWIYCVGVDPELAQQRPVPREPTHWIGGGRGREGAKWKTTPVPPGVKVCSAEQRRRYSPRGLSHSPNPCGNRVGHIGRGRLGLGMACVRPARREYYDDAPREDGGRHGPRAHFAGRRSSGGFGCAWPHAAPTVAAPTSAPIAIITAPTPRTNART